MKPSVCFETKVISKRSRGNTTNKDRWHCCVPEDAIANVAEVRDGVPHTVHAYVATNEHQREAATKPYVCAVMRQIMEVLVLKREGW